MAEWGCGSNCVVYAVIDAITGAVYEKGLPNPNEGYPCGLLYQRDSNLFVVEQSATIKSKCEPSLYVWQVHDSSRCESSRMLTASGAVPRLRDDARSNRSLALATPTRVLHFKVEHEPLRPSSDLSVDPFGHRV